jgi:hypothetical protein
VQAGKAMTVKETERPVTLGGPFYTNTELKSLAMAIGIPQMPTVVVYRFRKYNICEDCYVESKRMATREAVAKFGDGFSVIEDSAKEISTDDLDADGITRTDGIIRYYESELARRSPSS